LPELKILTHWQSGKFRTNYKCAKVSEFEVCPKCAIKSYSVHDKRWVKVQDAIIARRFLLSLSLVLVKDLKPHRAIVEA